MTEFTVWAPEAARVRLRLPARRPRDASGAGRLVAGRGARRRARHRLRVPARRRRPAAARPPLAPGSRPGVHGPSRRLRPRRVRLDRPRAGPAGSCPAACSTSCTSARSPPRARSTRRSSGSTTWSTSASTSSSCCRSTRSTASATGATTASAGTPPHEPYGGPDGLKRFVDAAHAKGLGVVLDVVYNHLGPVRGLPAAVRRRTSPSRATPGADRQPGRPALRRGAPLHHRQRADVAARLPRRRAAAGRRARDAGRAGPRTCWRSSPPRWRRCPRTSAGRCR